MIKKFKKLQYQYENPIKADGSQEDLTKNETTEHLHFHYSLAIKIKILNVKKLIV